MLTFIGKPVVEEGTLRELIGFDLGGMVHPVVTPGREVPAEGFEVFSTNENDQAELVFRVVQGNRPMARDCTELGLVVVRGISKGPPGMPQVLVRISVTEHSVSIAAEEGGKALEVTNAED